MEIFWITKLIKCFWSKKGLKKQHFNESKNFCLK